MTGLEKLRRLSVDLRDQYINGRKCVRKPAVQHGDNDIFCAEMVSIDKVQPQVFCFQKLVIFNIGRHIGVAAGLAG